jgi:hypothetical protein
MLAASLETMWKQSVTLLAMAFSYDVGQMTGLFRDYLSNPCTSTTSDTFVEWPVSFRRALTFMA